MFGKWPEKLVLYSAAAYLGYQGLRFLGRHILRDIGTDAVKTIMTDFYDENLWEFVSATTRYTPQVIVETNLRTQAGELIERPLGTPKRFPGLDRLMFNIAQLHILPTPLETPVDTSVVIGRSCRKPLMISMPVMISGMAYGTALSEKAKTALARGATLAGTAVNSGEGPFLPAERQAAGKWILQYNRGNWSKDEEIIKQADAVEIQIGQGATGGVGHIDKVGPLDFKLQKGYGVWPGQRAVVHSRQPGVSHPAQLAELVDRLKSIAGDIPVGVKIGAGKDLEKDLAWAVRAGADFVTVDGAEAAASGSAPILQDDFGVPTVFAVNRAAEFLRNNKLRDKVSLIASGKISTPGDILKVAALGADAAYIGGTALFAMSHTQVLKALPFEPPTQLLWYHGKHADEFDVETGAANLAKFLKSCREELMAGIRALGKTSVRQVDKNDLLALDELIAKGVGLPMVYASCE